MIDKNQLQNLIESTLKEVDERILKYNPSYKGLKFYSPEAVQLLMGTAAQESRLGTYILQIGSGIAKGIFQMEDATHNDIFVNYLNYRENIMIAICNISDVSHVKPDRLIFNLKYAILLARIKYMRVPEKLPALNDLTAQAKYWKKWYNTPLGAGTENEFIANYHKYLD